MESVTEPPQLLLRVRRPPDCPGVMYKVRLKGDFVAATVSRDGSPYGVLVARISSGQRVLLELPSIGVCPLVPEETGPVFSYSRNRNYRARI